MMHTDAMRIRWVWWAALAAGVMLLSSRSISAQQAIPSRFAVDTAIAVDQSVDQDGNSTTGVLADAVGSVAVGHGFEAIVRPFVQRLGSGEWNRQIWVAAMRYERAGRVAVRVDGGLIPSPVGMANLALRPHLNPNISQPASLFTPLPSAMAGAPRASLLGAVYPYGVHAAVSGARWDLRAAAIDSSPLRPRRVFARVNPPRFANAVVGGGVTPIVGVRVGASVTHGGWLRAGESPAILQDATATVVTVESDISFRYTKLAGEWVRDRLETGGGRVVASGWFVQGQQTLTPRWFLAGRLERMSAPALTAGGGFEPQRFTGVEETVGFRLTPELTVRSGHRARRPFGRAQVGHQVSVSLVWWQRSL
jgi:hypothetical protein